MIVKLEKAIRSLLEMLTEEYWKPVIETDLTDEELESAKNGLEHYRKHPEDFISLDDMKVKIYGKKSA